MKKFGYKKGIILFIKTPLPEISEEENENEVKSSNGVAGSATISKPLISQRHFVLGVIAQFSYVAAQTGVFSYLINFVTDENQKVHFDNDYGPLFLALGFALFMVGRMSGSYLMRFFKPTRMLAVYALMCCLLLPVVSTGLGWISLICLYGVFFFMSIGFFASIPFFIFILYYAMYGFRITLK